MAKGKHVQAVGDVKTEQWRVPEIAVIVTRRRIEAQGKARRVEGTKSPARQKRRVKMTPAWVDAVKPEAAPVDWADTWRKGLVLRVERSGEKTWWIRYQFEDKDHGPRGRRFKLGDADTLGLRDARKLATARLADVTKGIDPQAEKEKLRAGETVGELVASWLADHEDGPVSKWKGGLEPTGGSARSFLPHVRRLVRDLGGKKLAVLTSQDIRQFVAAPKALATKNRALSAVRGFLKWAKSETPKRPPLIETDPSAGIEKKTEPERTRTLTDAEMQALIRGFDPTRYGRAVRLLALTGLRRDEVLGAEWEWFNVEAATLTIPPEAEKTGRSRGEPRRVALSPQAVALLAEQRKALFAEGTRSPYIFATSTGERPHRDSLKQILYPLRGLRPNGQPASTDKRAKVRPVVLSADVTIHDVRRTVGDALLNRLGAAPWVVDHVVLGHARPKLLRTYMPTLPLDEARAALTRWAELLDGILTATPAAPAHPVEGAKWN